VGFRVKLHSKNIHSANHEEIMIKYNNELLKNFNETHENPQSSSKPQYLKGHLRGEIATLKRVLSRSKN